MSASDVVADIKLLLDGYSNHQSQLQSAKEQLNVVQDENKSLRQQLEQAKHINTQLDNLIKAHHSKVAAEVSIRTSNINLHVHVVTPPPEHAAT